MSESEPWEVPGEGALVSELGLSLRYRHGFGALSPFFAALRDGRAIGSRCPDCGDVRFPPRRLCLHDRTPTLQQALSGMGEVIRVTAGVTPIPPGGPAAHHVFAEIAMDGAGNRVVARLAGDPARLRPGARVRLSPPATAAAAAAPHPIQALVFEPVEGRPS